MAVEEGLWKSGCGRGAVEEWLWNRGCGRVAVEEGLWKRGCGKRAANLLALGRLGGLADGLGQVVEQPLHVLEQLRQEGAVARDDELDGAVDRARVELLGDAAPENGAAKELDVDSCDAHVELLELWQRDPVPVGLERHVRQDAPVAGDRLGQLRRPLQRVVEQDERAEQVAERVKGAAHSHGLEGGGEELLLRRVKRGELADQVDRERIHAARELLHCEQQRQRRLRRDLGPRRIGESGGAELALHGRARARGLVGK